MHNLWNWEGSGHFLLAVSLSSLRWPFFSPSFIVFDAVQCIVEAVLFCFDEPFPFAPSGFSRRGGEAKRCFKKRGVG